MGFSIYNLFKAGLLVTNGVAILHPQRFLSRYGLDRKDLSQGATPRNQLVDLLQAVQWLKIPLVGLNILFIIMELIAG